MKKLLLIVAVIFSVFSTTMAPAGAAGMDLFGNCTDPSCSVVKDNSLQQGSSNFAPKKLINTALYILAGICIIVIVVGAIRLTISNGDTGAVTSGKNAILYAVIGLVVAVLAYAIVNFVVASAIK
jgi:hypothetical protein